MVEAIEAMEVMEVNSPVGSTNSYSTCLPLFVFVFCGLYVPRLVVDGTCCSACFRSLVFLVGSSGVVRQLWRTM